MYNVLRSKATTERSGYVLGSNREAEFEETSVYWLWSSNGIWMHHVQAMSNILNYEWNPMRGVLRQIWSFKRRGMEHDALAHSLHWAPDRMRVWKTRQWFRSIAIWCAELERIWWTRILRVWLIIVWTHKYNFAIIQRISTLIFIILYVLVWVCGGGGLLGMIIRSIPSFVSSWVRRTHLSIF